MELACVLLAMILCMLPVLVLARRMSPGATGICALVSIAAAVALLMFFGSRGGAWERAADPGSFMLIPLGAMVGLRIRQARGTGR